MIVLETVLELRRLIASWRSRGESIVLVPTMGNLHEGHMALVERARELADRVVVSIFVNPLQFGEGEDYDAYPRTPELDRDRLAAANTDLLFLPPASEIYSRPRQQLARVEVPVISDILCGEFRPGHFIGVATVVCILFNMVQPDKAVFGEKDYQQLMIIRLMVADLSLPVEIHSLGTIRETDGLALSSRNRYLSAEERVRAPRLYQILRDTAEAILGGRRDFRRLEQLADQNLEQAGFLPDYFQIRRAGDLGTPETGDDDLVILAAAHLGRSRLIDNLRVTAGSASPQMPLD